MTVDHYIIAKLAEVMATMDSRQERQAVGCMIRNRVQKNSSSYFEELLRFSPRRENPSDPEFQQTLWDAEDIFYNRLPDIIRGAVCWSVRQQAGIDTVQVGSLYFFKDRETSPASSPIPAGSLDLFGEGD